MDLKVEIKELDELNREVSVEIAADVFNESMEKEYVEVRKKVVLKGFRKGKAPMNTIKSNYGDQVKADVIDKLVKDTYPQAVREKELRVASYPKLTDVTFGDDGVFRYKATVEVFPEIGKIEHDNLEISTEEITVADSEVDEYVEHLRKHHSELRKVERPAGDSDTVVVDLKKVYDPKLVLKEDNFPASAIDLSNPMTFKEFREQFPGMKAGDEKEIEVKYADDYSDPKFAGAEIKYHAKVKEVNERLLPEVDDALAKKVGLGETALELRLKLREDIQRQKEDDQKKQHKNMIIGQMCEKNQITVPNAVLDDYLDKIVEDFKKQNMEMDEASIRNQYRQVGINTFRWNMVYHQFARQEKIEVLPEDTEKLIKKFAENYKMTIDQAQEALQSSGRITDIRESILEEKVLDWLAGTAKKVKAESK